MDEVSIVRNVFRISNKQGWIFTFNTLFEQLVLVIVLKLLSFFVH